MSYHGDIRLGDTIDIKFSTRQFTTGAPFTLAGSPVVSAYPGNSTTQLTAGITLTVDFDGVTGLHNVRVVATGGNGYATATNYYLVITTGTVDSVSVVGEVIGGFSIEARSALMPTTAARTLDVSATGEADANVVQFGGSAGTFASGRPEVNTTHAAGTAWGSGAITAASIAADAITAAKIADGAIDAGALAADCITAAKIADNAIDAGSIATGAITAAKFAAGAIDAAAIADNAIDAGALAADCITAAKIANGAIDAATFAAGAIDATAIANGAIDAATFAAGAIDAAALAADAGTEIATAVWASAARTLTALDEDSTTLDLDATIRAAVGLAAANLDTQIGDLPTNAELATALGTADDAVLAAIAALPTAAANADAVWEEAIADHSGTAGSTAEQLAAAGAAGDPWATAVPGVYGAGTAGFIVGTNLNATVSSRASQASLDTVDDLLDTEIAAIKADTAAILDDTGTAGVVVADKTGYRLSATGVDDVLDEVVEGTTTLRQSIRLANSVNGGEASGAGTGTFVLRDVGDTKPRVTATVDLAGNRTAITLDLT